MHHEMFGRTARLPMISIEASRMTIFARPAVSGRQEASRVSSEELDRPA
jgi:hypothetical protein